MISIENRGLDQMLTYIGELENLTAQPLALTKKQQERYGFLTSAISALKQGKDPGEIRNWEVDRLLAELGQPRAPQGARTKLPEEVETEWRDFVQGRKVRKTSVPSDKEIRANEAGTQSVLAPLGAQGGYFVPPGINDRAFETMKKYDDIFDTAFCNIIETTNGAVMEMPAWDDLANESVQVGETNQSTEVDVASFATAQLSAYAFRSKIVACSLELLQDSNYPIGAVLERVFAMRHARGVGQALITGSGVSAPTGLLTAVVASGASPILASGSSGNTGNSDSAATTVGTQDLNALYGRLDPSYRKLAVWYMTDSTLNYLQGLLDKYGRPIISFRDGAVGQYGDTPILMGKRVAICQSMPAMGSTNHPIIFGDPWYFVARRVPSSMYVRSFWENPSLVQYGLVGFESWLRVDSNIVAANNSGYLPFQYIQSHS